ncbi:MAG: DUF2889 domain-containing protein [Candidatus Abyssobacteria bacterium SURF_5]|uniref:DUF2889 domain-containing protein n=1 Tax=Abyssobacteria bacterium (strain SURF_5) TaxID=2093360 RepID=A0A3A4NUC5_ABYX5|nr:MAG: DUF2889 domain-containing protein [Candidatus Abyssubacteria bacterium SURF_5]
MVLCYSRTKHASIAPLGEDKLLVTNYMDDGNFSGEIEIEVALPDLEITAARGKFERCFTEHCTAAESLVKKVIGLRVGSGLTKLLENLIGGPKGCSLMEALLFEACDAVILSFTPQQMGMADGLDDEQRREGLLQMVQMNPRLLNSCIAFDPNGPLLKGRL